MPGFQETCPVSYPWVDNHLDKRMVKLGGGRGDSKMALLWGMQPVLESESPCFFSPPWPSWWLFPALHSKMVSV